MQMASCVEPRLFPLCFRCAIDRPFVRPSPPLFILAFQQLFLFTPSYPQRTCSMALRCCETCGKPTVRHEGLPSCSTVFSQGCILYSARVLCNRKGCTNANCWLNPSLGFCLLCFFLCFAVSLHPSFSGEYRCLLTDCSANNAERFRCFVTNRTETCVQRLEEHAQKGKKKSAVDGALCSTILV